MFQFLLCRWYFRIFIWARLLWQVSRIRLNLVPTYPDRVGGDFQSLADRGNSYAVIQDMHVVPANRAPNRSAPAARHWSRCGPR